MRKSAMTNYAKLAAVLIGVWFASALTASAFHLFGSRPGDSPLPLGVAALAPIVLFLLWFASSAGFRQFVLSVDPRTLTAIQSWRIAGFVFLVLASFGLLPAMFAQPAGWGDMFIGATALLAARKLANPGHHRAFIVWQLLGIADLVTAVTTGTLSGLIDPHGIPTSAMTVLPLSMIPTFAVPLFLIFHIICIAQARRWPAEQSPRLGETLRSSAA
jgi:hypothetical protein